MRRKINPMARLIPKSDWAYGALKNGYSYRFRSAGKRYKKYSKTQFYSGFLQTPNNMEQQRHDNSVWLFHARLAAQGTLDSEFQAPKPKVSGEGTAR